MAEEKTDNSDDGIFINPLKDGLFYIGYNKKVLPLKKIDIEQINYITNPKSQAANKKLFDAAINVLNPKADLEKLRKELKEKTIELFDIEEPEEKEEEIIETSWEKVKQIIESNYIKRSEDIKVILSVIVSLWFSKGEAIYLVIVAPKATGKSTTANLFYGSKHTKCLDDLTEEAFSSGWASPKDDRLSLLEIIENKTLIIHDLSAIFSSKEDKVRRIFGYLTNSFGDEPYRKFSPGADREDGGLYNLVVGITPRIFYENSKHFLDSGRFFYYRLNLIDQTDIIKKKQNHPNKKLVKKEILNFLRYLKKKSENYEITLPDDLRDYMADFCECLVHYKLCYKDSKSNKIQYHNFDPEGTIRPFNQWEMLCKAICLIEDRKEITIEDVEYFKPMFWGLESKRDRAEKILSLPEKFHKDYDLDIFFDVYG